VTPIDGSPYLTGNNNPYTVAIDPLDRFVYVVNEGSNNVSAFALDATSGALSPLAGSPFATGINPSSLTIDPRGNFTVVTNAGSNTVSVYGIDAASGALTPSSGSPFATGTSPSAIAITD
jgi:6-phosphogluconolactonase